MSTARETEEGASATIFFRSAATHSYSAVVQQRSVTRILSSVAWEVVQDVLCVRTAQTNTTRSAQASEAATSLEVVDTWSALQRTAGRHRTHRCSPEQLMHAPESVRDARAT